MTDPIPHGLGGYTNHYCRCDICRAANAEYKKAYRRAGKVPREKTREYSARWRAKKKAEAKARRRAETGGA